MLESFNIPLEAAKVSFEGRFLPTSSQLLITDPKVGLRPYGTLEVEVINRSALLLGGMMAEANKVKESQEND